MKTENQNISTKIVKVVTITGIALWLVFALVMSIGGRYQAGAGNPPLALGLMFLVPIVVFVTAYWQSSSLRELASRLDLRLITAAHVWRMIGLDFLFKYAQGVLPGGFALPAGIGDVLTAAMAIPVALAISRGAPSARKWFVAWNVFGLLDLFAAVGMGILHSESSLGILVGQGPNTFIMSEFPRSMIPTFFVPLFILFHLLSLARRNEVATRREPLPGAGIQKSLSPCHP
jgi:hypothetical protein